MSKDKISTGKMLKDKVSTDKMSEDKMSKKLGTENVILQLQGLSAPRSCGKEEGFFQLTYVCIGKRVF
jgi:hypothetical protein